jgi:hypothetical protein
MPQSAARLASASAGRVRLQLDDRGYTGASNHHTAGRLTSRHRPSAALVRPGRRPMPTVLRFPNRRRAGRRGRRTISNIRDGKQAGGGCCCIQVCPTSRLDGSHAVSQLHPEAHARADGPTRRSAGIRKRRRQPLRRNASSTRRRWPAWQPRASSGRKGTPFTACPFGHTRGGGLANPAHRDTRERCPARVRRIH